MLDAERGGFIVSTSKDQGCHSFARAAADFGSVHEQHNTLVSYMHAHFPGPEKALAYLDCFQRVVAQTSKANPGERANTLKMVKYLKDSINAAIAHADGAGDASAEAYVPYRRAWAWACSRLHD
jgi:hypothetical protein